MSDLISDSIHDPLTRRTFLAAAGSGIVAASLAAGQAPAGAQAAPGPAPAPDWRT